MYARITHTRVSSDVCRARSSVGNAISSVPLLTVARNMPRLVTDRTHQQYEGWSGPTPDPLRGDVRGRSVVVISMSTLMICAEVGPAAAEPVPWPERSASVCRDATRTLSHRPEAGTRMRTIGTEEHFVTDEVVMAWGRLDATASEDSPAGVPPGELGDRLREVGQRRIAAMDEAGLDVQVISLTSPGLHSLPASEATRLQVATNDRIAELVDAHPDRFQGFATLATPAPGAAARELERAVTTLGLNGALMFGRTGERNLDHIDNWTIFEAAASLRAPLYIHPQVPQPGVRAALYAGFDDAVDSAFATYGIGWHYESGVQFLRLALAGVFDRFPDLQVLLGHWGEVVLFYLDRADWLAIQAKLPRPFSEYVRQNAYITAGGVYSQRYLRWAIEVVGVERILFATDYPYRPGPEGGVAHFLAAAGLDQADQERIAAGNWEALVAGIRR